MKAATVVNAVKIALGTAGVSTGATPAVRVAGTGETSLQAPTDQSKETVRVKVCGRRAVVSHPPEKGQRRIAGISFYISTTCALEESRCVPDTVCVSLPRCHA